MPTVLMDKLPRLIKSYPHCLYEVCQYDWGRPGSSVKYDQNPDMGAFKHLPTFTKLLPLVWITDHRFLNHSLMLVRGQSIFYKRHTCSPAEGHVLFVAVLNVAVEYRNIFKFMTVKSLMAGYDHVCNLERGEAFSSQRYNSGPKKDIAIDLMREREHVLKSHQSTQEIVLCTKFLIASAIKDPYLSDSVRYCVAKVLKRIKHFIYVCMFISLNLG